VFAPRPLRGSDGGGIVHAITHTESAMRRRSIGIAVCLLLTASTAIAKVSNDRAPATDDPKTELKRSFGEVSAWVTKAADMVPADKYDYRPTPGVRTFGQVVAHVADAYAYYCASAGGKKLEWSDAIEKGKTDKATIVQKLKETTASCTTAYGGSAVTVGPLIDNVGHTNLHYGNIITYMRMLGMVPPSS
jgi:uncharacterized damage-inducible protein DinB